MGWVPDVPDHRDFLYAAPKGLKRALPVSKDLRKYCPPVYDQGCLGSCTANAIGAAIEFNQIRQNKRRAFMPSRQFIYYNERAMEGTIRSDAGAQIRDGIKSVVKQGVCPENQWPYVIGTCEVTGTDLYGEPIYDTGTHFMQKPPASCYEAATHFQVLQYHRVLRSLNEIRACLAEGFPIVFGFTVYESFYDIGKDGVMPMPSVQDRSVGGHAVMAVGYQHSRKQFIVRNSWGATWGDKGYCYMPYKFLLSENCDDFWTIRTVEL